MTKRYKITALALVAAMLCGGTAQAADWINISEWSYNDVSAFISAGLLPESMSGVSNYKAEITRLQFTDLVVSVIKKTKAAFSDETIDYFADTAGSASADFLRAYDIVSAVYSEVGEKQHGDRVYTGMNEYFLPDERITREDAAVILYRAGKKFGAGDWPAEIRAGDLFDDKADFEAALYEPVCELRLLGIVNDIEDNKFMPKSYLTIEQAVTMLYRMYGTFIKTIKSDYEGNEYTEGDLTLKQFGELSEIYNDHVIYIKDGFKTYLALDADIYSIVSFAEYNGRRLAYAVNFNDKTDVYDIDEGVCISTLPYIVSDIDNERGLVYVVSSRYAPVLYGVYDMEGNIKLAPEYSMTELETVIANGYNEPEQTARPADGMIYFSNRNDGGALYRVDSNGENLKKLNSSDCCDLKYYNGLIFYNSKNDDLLHCIRSDGSDDRTVGDAPLSFPRNAGMWFFPERYENRSVMVRGSVEEYPEHMAVCAGGGLLLLDDKRHAYSLDISGGFELTRLTEGYTDAFVNGGRAYMLDTVNHALYMSEDGGDWERILDGYEIGYAGFEKFDFESDVLMFCAANEHYNYYSYNIKTGEISEESYIPQSGKTEYDERPADKTEEISEEINEALSDNDYTVTERSRLDAERGSVEIGFFTEHNGERSREIAGHPVKRFGDILLYEVTLYVDGDISYGLRRFYEYNMSTGERELFTDNYRGELFFYTGAAAMDNMYLYSDWNNVIYRYTPGTGAESIYPCKGLYRYGETKYILKPDPSNGRLYKLDSSGNLYRLTDAGSDSEVYVKNGEMYAETMDY